MAKEIAYRFVNEYFDALYEKAQGLAEFLTLHGCPVTRSDAGQLSCSSASQLGISYQKLRTFQTKDFSLQIDCVDSMESLDKSVVTMVVGHVYSKQCTNRSFFQTFVVTHEHNEKLSVYNDMLWYNDEKAPAIASLNESEVPSNDKLDVCREVFEEMIDNCKNVTESQHQDTYANGHSSNIEPEEGTTSSIKPEEGTTKETYDNGHISSTELEEGTTKETYDNAHISSTELEEGTTSKIDGDEQVSQTEDKGVEKIVDENISPTPNAEKPRSTQSEKTNVEKVIDEAALLNEDEKTSSSLDKDEAMFDKEEFALAFPCLTATVTSWAPTKNAFVTQKEGPHEPTPKFSYASILNACSKLHLDDPTTAIQKPCVKAPPAQAVMPATSSKHEGLAGSSVCVRNLPSKITLTRIYNEFKLFGPLKPLGVNLRNPKVGSPFAFVDFKDAISAQKAVKASPITIDGQKVFVDEKRKDFHKGTNNKQFTAVNNGSNVKNLLK